jgi:hypothetical protein
MRSRVALEQVARDPWATEDLRRLCVDRVSDTEVLAQAWLDGVEPAGALDLEGGPLVVVVDAASADLWLCVQDRLDSFVTREGGHAVVRWLRLEADARTPSALGALLGAEGDPVEAAEARGIAYSTLVGDEEGSLTDLAPLRADSTAAVLRLALLDRRAHAGEATLEELAALLDGLLARRLDELAAACRAARRTLILTADHGLTLAGGRLVHGAGGPWERAIFRFQWTPGPSGA